MIPMKPINSPQRLKLVSAGMTGIVFWSLLGMMVLCTPVLAGVPVIDATRLNQQTHTDDHVTLSVKAVGTTKTATNGIACSTTTGQHVPVVNPSVAPKDGAATMQGLVPNLATLGPAAGAPQAGFSNFGNNVGGLLAGLNAVLQTAQASAPAYQSLSGQIGTAQTIQQAMDQNSGVRTQNGETAASMVVASNNLTQAYNTKNMMKLNEISGIASALGGASASAAGGGAATMAAGVCPLGTSGAGTMASPCIENGCSTTAYGVTPDASCVTRQFVDTYGNVRIFLAHIQDSFVGMTPSSGS